MIPFYKMQLDPSLEGMDFNAVVDTPAHMKAYETFAKVKKVVQIKDHFNEEKRIVTGVAIAVDLPMYRDDEQLGPHYVFFKKEDTQDIWIKMMENNYLHNVNNMHEEEEPIDGMVMFHSYAVDKEGGLYPEMFKDQNLKDGSIVVSYKAQTDEAWQKIKENTGFSIEGWFKKVPVKMKGQFMKTGKTVMVKLPTVKDKFGSVIQEIDKWDIDIIEDTVSVGDELHYSWVENGVEMDGGRVRDGEYVHDGRKIQVNSDGIVLMIDGQTELRVQKSKNSKMKKGNFLKKVFGKTKFGNATTVGGIEIFWDGELAEGVEIKMKDENGDEVLAPEGDHTFANEDGTMTVVTVDGNGVATSVETVDAPDDDEEMAEALRKIIADGKAAREKMAKDHKVALDAAVKDAVKAVEEKLTGEIQVVKDMLQTLCVEMDKSEAAKEALEKLKGDDGKGGAGGTEDGKHGYRKYL